MNSLAGFEALLRYVERHSDCRIVRGGLVPDCDPDDVYRRNNKKKWGWVAFVDVPRSWGAVDIDGFKGEFAACRALLPAELREAAMVLQLSASHGHPSMAATCAPTCGSCLPVAALGSIDAKRWLQSLGWPADWRSKKKRPEIFFRSPSMPAAWAWQGIPIKWRGTSRRPIPEDREVANAPFPNSVWQVVVGLGFMISISGKVSAISRSQKRDHRSDTPPRRAP